MSVTLRMRVLKYVPARLYGFAGLDGQEVFFHLGTFQPGKPGKTPRCTKCAPCLWVTTAPSPIVGEEVDVTYKPDSTTSKAPAAVKVIRILPPLALEGQVEVFDPHRGYGFIAASDGQSHYLHASEILDGRTPVVGERVRFFVGTRLGKPRACYVRLCR